MKNQGKILAFDLSKSKLPLISSGALRLGIDIISASVHDGRDLMPEFEGTADKIICDVPCSGFGVTAKKPDIRYKNLNDARALPQIQYDILCTAEKYLKVGGTLVYSTCTILPEENEQNVKRFLSEHDNFSLVPFNAGELQCSEGMITLLPHIHKTDGFFVAKLCKTK
jgi:16S rRNA (cytosine967-C5)-methyltransferase